MKHITFKLQGHSGAKWEDQPVYARLAIDTTLTKAERIADDMGKTLANLYGCQSRWEYEGVGQGHYNYPD